MQSLSVFSYTVTNQKINSIRTVSSMLVDRVGFGFCTANCFPKQKLPYIIRINLLIEKYLVITWFINCDVGVIGERTGIDGD